MKNIFFVLLLIPFFSLSNNCDSITLLSITNPGPFNVISFEESSGIRNGSLYSGATIYCPSNGINLSSIVLVPGFMNSELTIQNWGPFLASYGIVTMTIGTNSLTDDEYARRNALEDAIISLKQENSRSVSPLYNRLNLNSISVGGFSKGGGGAQLLAKIDSSLRSIISLYPFIENPTITDFNHSIPTLIISGQLDIIAPPTFHADVHYDFIPQTTNKLKFEVFLGSHDPVSGPNGAMGEVGVRVLSWLANFMLNDICYCPLLLNIPSLSSQYLNNLNCNISYNNQIYNYHKTNFNQVFDLFGRESKKETNKLFFIKSNSGIVTKKFIVE